MTTKTLIDWTKPIELVDGTPAAFKGRSENTPDAFNVATPAFSKKRNGETVQFAREGQHYDAYGVHMYGQDQDVRNVAPVVTFDPSKPVQTRDGRKARVIASDRVGPNPVVALVTSRTGDLEMVTKYKADGRVHDRRETGNDLINVPERTERYFAVYPLTGRVGATVSEFSENAVANIAHSKDRPLLKVIYEGGKYKATEVLA